MEVTKCCSRWILHDQNILIVKVLCYLFVFDILIVCRVSYSMWLVIIFKLLSCSGTITSFQTSCSLGCLGTKWILSPHTVTWNLNILRFVQLHFNCSALIISSCEVLRFRFVNEVSANIMDAVLFFYLFDRCFWLSPKSLILLLYTLYFLCGIILCFNPSATFFHRNRSSSSGQSRILGTSKGGCVSIYFILLGLPTSIEIFLRTLFNI